MRMLRHNRLLQAAVVAAGIVAFGATDALAWGHKGSYGSSSSASYASSSSSSYGSYGSSSSSSYGSYGSSSSSSYASYGSSSSGSSASAGSSSGGRQGFFARWHAKKAAKHSSGSSSSYGSYAYSSSGSSASYSGSSSSGSSASYGGYAAPSGYYDNVPMETAPAEGAIEAQPVAPVDPAASIRVNLPADALVFVNDRPTTSTGTERTFVSRGLAGGRTYAYELRVEFTVDGEKVVENKVVRLHAGESIDLSFGSGEQVASEGPASTDLTLHVPADAKVTLAGAVTQQTGETRTYATNSLAPGQEWDGYVVRVELQKDGKTLVEEKTISIVGGEAYELSFDFAGSEAHVASLN